MTQLMGTDFVTRLKFEPIRRSKTLRLHKTEIVTKARCAI